MSSAGNLSLDRVDLPSCPYVTERGIARALGYVETGQMSEADLVEYLELAPEKFRHRDRLVMKSPTWAMRFPKLTLDDYLDGLADEEQRDTSRKDFGSLCGSSKQDFFPDKEVFEREAKPKKSPILNGQTASVGDEIQIAEWFKPKPTAAYAIAFDYSGGGEGKTDGTGASMVHFDLTRMVFVEDFSFRVKAKPGELMQYAPLNQLVRDLEKRGFRIAKVGFDQYASGQSMEILQREGFDVVRVKHSDSLAGCYTMRELIGSGRYEFSEESTVFIGEAKELQEIQKGRTRRIDHKSSGGAYNSKDVWDASVNAVHLANEAVENDQGEPIRADDLHSYPASETFAIPLDVSQMPSVVQHRLRLPGHNGFGLVAFLYCRYHLEHDPEIVSIAWGAVEQESKDIWLLGVETSKVPLQNLGEWVVETVAPWQELPFLWKRQGKGSFWFGMFDDSRLEIPRKTIRSFGLQTSTVDDTIAPTLRFEQLRKAVTKGSILFPNDFKENTLLRSFVRQMIKYPFGANDYGLQAAFGLLKMTERIDLVRRRSNVGHFDFDEL